MTTSEAAAELGLSGGGPFPSDQVRRAYLRLVKQRKPEIDPEGFRRLREAYEHLKLWAVATAGEADATAGEADATVENRVFPPAALRERLRFFEQEDRPGREDSPHQRLGAAEAMIEDDDGEGAVAAVEGALRGAGDEPNPYLVSQVLRLVLSLHARNQASWASRMFAAVRSHAQQGVAFHRTSQETAALFVVCTELEALPDLPIELRPDVARGALAGDLGMAVTAMEVFERVHGNRAFRRWRRKLRQRAPTLARFIVPKADPSIPFVMLTSLASVVLIGLFMTGLVLVCDRVVASPSYSLTEKDMAAVLELHRDVLQRCGRPEPPVCQVMKRSLWALREKRSCSLLNLEMQRLDPELPTAGPELRALGERLTALIVYLCP